jgi:hypothetical protein
MWVTHEIRYTAYQVRISKIDPCTPLRQRKWKREENFLKPKLRFQKYKKAQNDTSRKILANKVLMRLGTYWSMMNLYKNQQTTRDERWCQASRYL